VIVGHLLDPFRASSPGEGSRKVDGQHLARGLCLWTTSAAGGPPGRDLGLSRGTLRTREKIEGHYKTEEKKPI
jgi:hypothetical protein